jgi:tetratricopeptide (TPR) repeat protein
MAHTGHPIFSDFKNISNNFNKNLCSIRQIQLIWTAVWLWRTEPILNAFFSFALKTTQCKNCPMKKVLLGVMLLVFCGLPVQAAERMTVAFLPPSNESGDANTAHWQYALIQLMHSQLFEVKSIRLLPDSSIDYAFRQLKLKQDAPLEPGQARKLGETIEARRVIWSEYKQKGNKYALTLHVLNVASGKVSKQLTFSGTDWFQVVSNSVNSALHELAVVPTPEEEIRMNRYPTRSAEALELFARGTFSEQALKPLSESESLFRQAVAMDPAFSAALDSLASYILIAQGKMVEAEEIARKAAQIHPDYSTVHAALGIVYEFEGTNQLARDELLEAVRLYPDDPENYQRLGEIHSRMKNIEAAISAFKQCELLAPFSSRPHAFLAMTYAIQGSRELALAELKIAERLEPGDDMDVDQMLAATYQELKDMPHYVEHAEKYLAAARLRLGAQNQLLIQAEKDLVYGKRTLNPHFLAAPTPKTYSREELDTLLEARLTPEEYQSITNPFTISVEMKTWAVELTKGAKEEQQKAKCLFDRMLHHLDRGSSGGKRTAEQTFGVWKEPNIYLTCQEYALLYVTLAREVGLRAWVASVTKDWEGTPVLHACAGVFIDDKVLLVDPTYEWFGAPHQEYELQDDFQMIGAFLCQLPYLESKRLGVKLRPEFSFGHFNLALHLAGNKQPNEARKELAAGLAIDPISPYAVMTEGMVEASEHNLDAAVEHLRQALNLGLERGYARYTLGMVLYNQGKLLEARDQFQKYLEGQTEPDQADVVQQMITFINGSLGKTKSSIPR